MAVLKQMADKITTQKGLAHLLILAGLGQITALLALKSESGIA